MSKIVGNADDYVRRGDVLKDIEELDMIDTVDGLGRPVDKEDIRIQMYGTVIYTPKVEAVPCEYVRDKIKSLRAANTLKSNYLAEAYETLLVTYEKEKAQ